MFKLRQNSQSSYEPKPHSTIKPTKLQYAIFISTQFTIGGWYTNIKISLSANKT